VALTIAQLEKAVGRRVGAVRARLRKEMTARRVAMAARMKRKERRAVTVTLSSTIRMMVPAVRRRCKGSSNYARSAGWCKLKRTLQLEPRTVLSGRR